MAGHTHEILAELRPLSSPKDKQSRSRQAEEQRIDRHDIVEDLIVFPGQRDDYRPDTLQDDRDNWHTGSLAYVTELL